MDADPAYPDPDSRNALAEDCRRCPALAEARECISWGNGPADADVVVVGEAPGAGDPDADRWRGGNWTGLAYTSRHSGRRVRDLLAAVGHPDAYYTNAVKCFPRAEPSEGDGPDPADATNREPTAEERANCRPYLREEIGAVDPRVVVPTGRHATESVFALADRELDGFLETVLEPFDFPALGVRVVPILHPSYQAVWLPRIEHTVASYRAALADLLAEGHPV
jgi:DNA polymerase